jgi:hypothetical protein
MAILVLALAGVSSGCGSGPPSDGDRSRASPEEHVLHGGPPDGGTAAGHGADLQRQRGPAMRARVRDRVRVPNVDRTPPHTSLRVEGTGTRGGRIVARASSADWPSATHVRLASPRVRVTARARDAGGMGRVRISIEEKATCAGPDGARRSRLRLRYLPPPAIMRIRVPPGAVLPVELARRARLHLGGGRLCGGQGWRPVGVRGRLWSDATNAFERESSALVRYEHRAAPR